ncbi:PHD and RING finger domain-containing protein 1-like isoform X2 [Eleginops maclovinus]
MDRISFGFICQRRCPGGAIQKKIKVRTKKKGEDDHDEEEESQAVTCEECGRSDRRHRLLVCTHCDSGYHMDCLTPPLNTGREGDWICAECAVTPQHTEDSVVEVEISDGELTDLLAEADESESTGSRLRPSTINRSSSSTERRHSERVQSRADPLPLPQTSWHVPKYLLRASKAAVTTEEEAALHSATSSASDKVNTRKRKRHAT